MGAKTIQRKEKMLRCHSTLLQVIPQSHGEKSSTDLKTHANVDGIKGRGQMWTHTVATSNVSKPHTGEKTGSSFSKWCWENHTPCETRSLSPTLTKTQIDQRPEWNPRKLETQRKTGKHSSCAHRQGLPGEIELNFKIWDHTEVKEIFTMSEMVKNQRSRQITEREKMFTGCDKELISTINKEYKKENSPILQT